MKASRTLINHATGEAFELPEVLRLDKLPAWVVAEVQVAERILARSQPMCPVCAGIVMDDDPAKRVQRMRLHLEVSNCGRVAKGSHNEDWIFAEETHE